MTFPNYIPTFSPVSPVLIFYWYKQVDDNKKQMNYINIFFMMSQSIAAPKGLDLKTLVSLSRSPILHLQKSISRKIHKKITIHNPLVSTGSGRPEVCFGPGRGEGEGKLGVGED